MIVTIKHGKSGWGNYVVKGTAMHKRNQKKIYKGGNIKQGDLICEGGYYSVVLGFKGKVSTKKAIKILKEWESLFMAGFGKEEYYMDFVIHQDTDDTHAHVRFSDTNLLTGTKLKFYYHKTDMKRKEAISNYLDAKYGLESPLDNKVIMKENYYEFLDEWRKLYGDEELKYKRKKDRDNFRKRQNEKLLELLNNGNITNYEDVKKFWTNINYKIVNEGFDEYKQSHFITIANSKNQKVKMYGDFYNPTFALNSHKSEEIPLGYKQNGKSKKKYINKERHIDNLGNLELLKKKVIELNSKRKKFVGKRYGSARKKAYKKLQQEAMKLEFDDIDREDLMTFRAELSSDERIKKQEELKEQDKQKKQDSKKATEIIEINDDISVKESKVVEVEGSDLPIFNPISFDDIYF